MGPARLATAPRSFIRLQRRSVGACRKTPVGSLLIHFGGTLVARRVGLVLLFSGLVGVGGGLVSVGSAWSGPRLVRRAR